MTLHQYTRVLGWVGQAFRLFGQLSAHHGVCEGADEQFHQIVRQTTTARIHGHPGVTPDGRAWHRANLLCDTLHPPLGFLARNRIIVLSSDLLLAAPAHFNPQPRSGTWATIRHARKLHTPLILAFPDGTWEAERCPVPWEVIYEDGIPTG